MAPINQLNVDQPSRPTPAVSARRSRLRAFRPDIEGLRAVAVLAVVLDHFNLAVHGGYIGVDVFYVISGFLITNHLYSELDRSGRISIVRFYARRVRRILPAATVVIIVTMLAVWRWGAPLNIHADGLDGITAALFCINFRLAGSGANYFANTSPSPFQQYWSLAIEEQFYALWPLLLLAVTSATRRLLSRRRAVSITLLAVIAASLLCSVATTKGSPSWAYFGLQTRAWELALGALLAINSEWISRALVPVASGLSWLGAAAILVAAFAFTSTTSYPGIAVTLPVIGTALVIAAGCAAPRGGAENVLFLGPFQYVGRISYSWYLWHWPVLIFLPAVLGHSASTVDNLLAVAGSFALASVSYALVEQPFRRTQRLEVPRNGIVLGAGLIVVSVISVVVIMIVVAVPTGTGAGASLTASATENVALGAKLRALPANLSPPLSAVPGASPFTCITPLSGASLSPSPGWTPTCTLGDRTSARTAVLFGDSHAWQWTRPLDAVAAKRRWKLITYTKAACPVDTTDFAANDALYAPRPTHCAEWRDAILARLSKLRPAVVILASRTFSFAQPKALTDTIAKLKADGSQVVWLQDTPTASSIVPTCLSQYPNDLARCTFSRTSGLAFPKLRDENDRVAARAGATVVDTVPWLCTDRICPPVISNTVVYLDDSHITNAFALTLTNNLSEALAPVMPS